MWSRLYIQTRAVFVLDPVFRVWAARLQRSDVSVPHYPTVFETNKKKRAARAAQSPDLNPVHLWSEEWRLHSNHTFTHHMRTSTGTRSYHVSHFFVSFLHILKSAESWNWTHSNMFLCWYYSNKHFLFVHISSLGPCLLPVCFLFFFKCLNVYIQYIFSTWIQLWEQINLNPLHVFTPLLLPGGHWMYYNSLICTDCR